MPTKCLFAFLEHVFVTSSGERAELSLFVILFQVPGDERSDDRLITSNSAAWSTRPTPTEAEVKIVIKKIFDGTDGHVL